MSTPTTEKQELPNAILWRNLTHVLALNRSAQFIDELSVKGKDYIKNNSTSQKEELEAMVYRIHAHLYQDTHSFEANHQSKAGYLANPDKGVKLRQIIHAFAEDLFDTNAQAVGMKRSSLAEIYAKCFKELSDLKPFEYGNGLTISTFITAVSSLPRVKLIEDTSIDFRRLDTKDLEAFDEEGMPKVDGGKLVPLFEKALDKNINLAIPNKRSKAHQLAAMFDENGNKISTLDKSAHPNALKADEEPGTDGTFYGWSNNAIEIGGVPFLGVEQDGELYLLTVTGGMVPFKEAKEQLQTPLQIKQLVNEYPAFRTEKYLENKSIKNGAGVFRAPDSAGTIDGYEHNKDAAPLICMDVNILTGLRQESHEKFEQAFKDFVGDKPIFELKNDEESSKFLALVTQQGDERLLRIATIAVKHIKAITTQMDAALGDIFNPANKPAPEGVEKPLLVISMGGSGSGKSGVEHYMQKNCPGGKDNYVFTSLDDFRKLSGIYNVMQAANHHADDYKLVEPFANALRDWVANAAMERNINILYDGSAIPYKGRYEPLIKIAKISGNFNGKTTEKKEYRIDVAAADSYMSIPEGARTSNLTERIDQRVVQRYNKEKRCLPWAVTIGKHSQAMQAFLDAAVDSNVTQTILYNTDGMFDKNPEKNQAYVAAFAFTPNNEDKLLAEQITPEAYREVLSSKGLEDKDINKIPYLNEENIGYTRRVSGKKERLMLITDMHKLVQMAEKGLQNPHASDLDALDYRLAKHAAVLPSHTMNSVQRIVGVANKDMDKVWNHLKPSDNYQQAQQEKCDQYEAQLGV